MGNGTIDKLTITKGNCGEVEPPKPIEPFTFDSIMTDEAAGVNGSINTDTLGNKRFAGSDPNNYVCFGIQGDVCDEEHLYRIIGIIDGVPKLIKNSYYSTSIAWDTTNSNDWGRPASLKIELNGSNFYGNTNYIDISHKGYIVNATWYTGGIAYTEGENYLFNFENLERDAFTTDYIGLMSITDFGYASNDINCNSNSTDLFTTNNACMSNNWLFYSNTYQWTITARNGNADRVWSINVNGYVNRSYANSSSVGARPSMFLDPTVKIKSGEGTNESPYILN